MNMIGERWSIMKSLIMLFKRNEILYSLLLLIKMHKALGAIARAARSARSTSVQQPPKVVLSVTTNDQENRDQESTSQDTQNGRSSMFMKASLVSFVLLVGQKMDDTLAHMFAWGASIKVAR